MASYRDEIHESLAGPQGADLRANRRHRRRADDIAARAIGGVRNWDYRYCWLRDASLTLMAMLERGLRRRRPLAWREWLLRAVAGDPADVQIMYGVAGERRLDERELDWLPGFSIPGRCGSATPPHTSCSSTSTARCSTPPTRRCAMASRAPTMAGRMLRHMLTWLEDGWRQKDAGIWEVRGPSRHFTHSKVMAWVAFDRGVRMLRGVRARGAGRALAQRCAMRSGRRSWSARWSERKQAFTQSYGSDALDASVLQMPLVGFICRQRPPLRLDGRGHPARIERRRLPAALPRRRGRRDGLPPGEGVFLACSFWLVEVLALQGRPMKRANCSSACSACATMSVC